jgi:sulfur-oxidizing protein SoxZ
MATKMRIRIGRDGTEIVARVEHPMETGARLNPQTQEPYPPHFIQKVSFFRNGTEVAVADIGSAVSRDPLVRVKIRAKPGDVIRLTWSDNKGETGSAQAIVPRPA